MSDFAPKVFVSHSSKDDAIARSLEMWLNKLGFECWAYYNDINLDFRASIQTNIDTCDLFLLISSRSSLESNEVIMEINYALTVKRQFVIYRLDQHPFPNGIEYQLISIKWIDATNNSTESFKNLALQMLTATGEDEATAKQKLQNTCVEIEAYRQEQQKLYETSLMMWLDKMWTYRYNYQTKRSRSLNSWDKEKLKLKGDELGITEADRAEAFKKYKRNLRAFRLLLSQCFKSFKLNRSKVRILEDKRRECCIPLKEAKHIAREEISKLLKAITLTQGATELDSWIVILIREINSSQSIATTKNDYGNHELTEPDSANVKDSDGEMKQDTSLSTGVSIANDTKSSSTTRLYQEESKPRSAKTSISALTDYTKSTHNEYCIVNPHISIDAQSKPKAATDKQSTTDVTEKMTKRSYEDRQMSKILNLSDTEVSLEQYFLGNHISSNLIKSIAFSNGKFEFFRDDASGKSLAIDPIRDFYNISLHKDRIVMHQDGFKNYFILKMYSGSPIYSTLYKFLRGCGLVVLFQEENAYTNNLPEMEHMLRADVEPSMDSRGEDKKDVPDSEKAIHSLENIHLKPANNGVNLTASLSEECLSFVNDFKALNVPVLLDKTSKFKVRIWESGSVATIKNGISDLDKDISLVRSRCKPEFNKGAMILHFNDGRIGFKRGICIYERGFQIFDETDEDFFLFGHPEVNPKDILSKASNNHGKVEFKVKSFSLVSKRLLSHAFIFKSSLATKYPLFIDNLGELLICLDEKQRITAKIVDFVYSFVKGSSAWENLLGCIGPTSRITIDGYLPGSLRFDSDKNNTPFPVNIFFYLNNLSASQSPFILIASFCGLYFNFRTNANLDSGELLYLPWPDLESFEYKVVCESPVHAVFIITTKTNVKTIAIRSVITEQIFTSSVESSLAEFAQIIMEVKKLCSQLES